jgi:replicative DNA helicase
VTADLTPERAFLGACLLGQPAALQAVPRLEVDDFTEPTHRHVLGAVRDLLDEGRPVEPLGVLAVLRRQDVLGRWPGGRSPGPDLLDLQESCPLPASGDYFAESLLEQSAVRRVVVMADRLAQAAGGCSAEALRRLVTAEGRAAIAALGRVSS